MADIFISYSKPDREKVVMLAAYLELEGWTVWWDTNLAVGQAYRDEIMQQLTAARAVIVLWTQNSINSDFVRAEAGRAKADGKLIPLKESNVAYGDIPLPFGEMHTEDSLKRELIRAAIVAQLAKPQAQPNALWLAGKTLRYQALTWAGILGGAITLFANLQGVLTLSKWAKWFTNEWRELTVGFWQFVGAFVGIRPPAGVALMLSFLCFCLLTALGARRSTRAEPLALVDKALPQKMIARSLVFLIVIVASTLLLISYQFHVAPSEQLHPADLIDNMVSHSTYVFIFLGLPFVIVFGFPAEYDLKYFPVLAITYAMLLFYVILFYGSGIRSFVETIFPLIGPGAVTLSEPWQERTLAVVCFYTLMTSLKMIPFILVAMMLLIAPVRAVGTRMLFLAFGVLCLVGLNQLSHYAPYVEALLKRAG